MVSPKSLSLWLFNPLALRTAARREHPWNTAANLDAVLLPGTQTRASVACQVSYTSYERGELIVDFGWERGPMVNHSRDVAIRLGGSMGGQKYTKQVWTPPAGLRDRGQP